jgi:hypothetical protein
MGASHFPEEHQKNIPDYIKTNWVYILCYIAKDICLVNHQSDNRSMENAVKAIECKVLDIFDKIANFRLNL